MMLRGMVPAITTTMPISTALRTIDTLAALSDDAGQQHEGDDAQRKTHESRSRPDGVACHRKHDWKDANDDPHRYQHGRERCARPLRRRLTLTRDGSQHQREQRQRQRDERETPGHTDALCSRRLESTAARADHVITNSSVEGCLDQSIAE